MQRSWSALPLWTPDGSLHGQVLIDSGHDFQEPASKISIERIDDVGHVLAVDFLFTAVMPGPDGPAAFSVVEFDFHRHAGVNIGFIDLRKFINLALNNVV